MIETLDKKLEEEKDLAEPSCINCKSMSINTRKRDKKVCLQDRRLGSYKRCIKDRVYDVQMGHRVRLPAGYEPKKQDEVARW